MLAGLEQPDGGLAISFQGDFRGSMRASAVLLLCVATVAVATGKMLVKLCFQCMPAVCSEMLLAGYQQGACW